MSQNGKVIDKDLGLNKFLAQLKELAKPKHVTVGIVEGSPKEQFRYGTLQKFRPETADLLLRQVVDITKGEIQNDLLDAAKAQLEGGHVDELLYKIGRKIKIDMGAKTDPPPQLRNSLVIKVNGDI